MLSDVSVVLRGREEPFLSCIGVGGGLCSCESFGCDKEQRGRRVRISQRFCHVSAVDIGYKMELEAAVSIRLQGLGDHDRSSGTV